MRRTTFPMLLVLLALIPAEGAVLCQKKQKFRVRADACTGKEALVQDLAALGALGPKLDQVAADALATCAGAPSRTKVTGGPVGLCGGGCRTFDGDEAACNGAFVIGTLGATSCAYFNGRCFPCDECGARVGLCQNACAGPVATCADATRTAFAGGIVAEDYYTQTYACRSARSEAQCEKSWHVMGQDGTAASCYWTGSRCNGCGPYNENHAECENTCAPISCADASRTNRVRCTDLGDQTACEQAWHVGVRGGRIPASCFWDASTDACRGCGLRRELKGFCDNTCD